MIHTEEIIVVHEITVMRTIFAKHLPYTASSIAWLSIQDGVATIACGLENGYILILTFPTDKTGRSVS